jgi:outer membrane protein TolC
MKVYFLLIFSILFSAAKSQTIITVDYAVKIALKNNYDILVAGNESAVSKINNSVGNAGMLPNAAISGNGIYEFNHTNQTVSGGTQSDYPSLSAKSYNIGASLSWTLFDGGKMFVTKTKLNEIEALGEIQFKDKVLQTQFNVISAYYDVVKQKQELKSIQEIIRYNKDLVKISQTAFDGGLLVKTTLLQAKIDLNVYREDSINQQYAINAAKKNLNQFLGFNADSSFEVADSIPLNYTFNKQDLMKKIYSSNTNILLYQKQIDIAELSVKEYVEQRYPQINFNVGYYLSHTDNSAGSVLKNQTFGPQIGASVYIPVFQSGKFKRQISIAKLDAESAKYNFENIKLQINTELLNAINDFENQQNLLKIETENKKFTEELLKISLQRLKLGQTTSLEVHMTQENYMQSCTRLINFEYNLKISETKLKQLIAEM